MRLRIFDLTPAKERLEDMQQPMESPFLPRGRELVAPALCRTTGQIIEVPPEWMAIIINNRVADLTDSTVRYGEKRPGCLKGCIHI